MEPVGYSSDFFFVKVIVSVEKNGLHQRPKRRKFARGIVTRIYSFIGVERPFRSPISHHVGQLFIILASIAATVIHFHGKL